MVKRILIVNKFYYPRGGDCVCAMNTEQLLCSAGYSVGVYSMQYPQNIQHRGDDMYATRVEFGGNIAVKYRAFQRIIGYGDIRRSFHAVLNEFKPDIVHFHNIHSYLSPIVVKMAHDYGAKTVWTMHDYKLICPAYSCRRQGNDRCEQCFASPKAHSWGVVSHRCMKNSAIASIMSWLEALKWNRRYLESITDRFICPSNFLRTKMIQAGFSSQKLALLHNSINKDRFDMLSPAIQQRDDYYLYVGRISSEKGIYTLLDTATRLPYKLRVLGSCDNFDEVKARYASSSIEFLGMCDSRQVVTQLNAARFMVIPSECYENNPLSVIESLCAGTPVVGARIGGIPEIIDAGNSVTFESGNESSLSAAIANAWEKEWNYSAIQKAAVSQFSPRQYLSGLEDIYKNLE